MKNWKVVAALVFLVLLLAAAFQPWSYNHHGFDEVSLAIAGGELKFELVDQVRKKDKNSYCLFHTFKTNDKPGEPITITIDKIETKTIAELRPRITNSGKTESPDNTGKYPTFFQPPGISKLHFPADEPLRVSGSIHYKGISQPFLLELKLKYWEKSREVISFCV